MCSRLHGPLTMAPEEKQRGAEACRSYCGTSYAIFAGGWISAWPNRSTLLHRSLPTPSGPQQYRRGRTGVNVQSRLRFRLQGLKRLRAWGARSAGARTCNRRCDCEVIIVGGRIGVSGTNPFLSDTGLPDGWLASSQGAPGMAGIWPRRNAYTSCGYQGSLSGMSGGPWIFRQASASRLSCRSDAVLWQAGWMPISE